jgi:hypothetical protein
LKGARKGRTGVFQQAGPLYAIWRMVSSPSLEGCAIMGTVRRSVRARSSRVSSPAFTRWGGATACLAGLYYGALGYLDAPDSPEFVIGTVVPALELTTPALFLGGFVGLYSQLGRGGGRLRRMGLVVGMLGTTLGVVQGLDWWPTLPYLANWLTPLFAGLAVAGAATLLFEDAPRLLGAMVLVSATLGWVSLLTDPAFPGVLVPTRAVRVGFATLFCVSAIAWGWALFRRPA